MSLEGGLVLFVLLHKVLNDGQLDLVDSDGLEELIPRMAIERKRKSTQVAIVNCDNRMSRSECRPR